MSESQPRDGTRSAPRKRPRHPSPLLPPLQGPPGVTSVGGEVRAHNEQPLEGVTLRIGEYTARTDSTGRFLLSSIPPGHHELLIDGRTANRPGHTYGVFVVGINVKSSRTNALPFVIWMPEIDTTYAVEIPSPTTEEVVLTTPSIPGLEVRIPPGTVITDVDGQVVTNLSITPIPVGRPPFPMPPVEFPIYFTIQPGGAYISPPGAKVIYPNFTNEPAGTRIDYWHYDAEGKGWYFYGRGTVTADGKQIIPDPGLRVYELTGVSFGKGRRSPKKGPPVGDPAEDGDPVDLSTGLFVFSKTDLFLPDVMPVALTRTYRPEDDEVRPFGIGTTHPYEIYMTWVTPFEEADLILPGGGRVRYSRISGAEFTAVFEHAITPSMFYKSQFRFDSQTGLVRLTLKDGTEYQFDFHAILQTIQDRNGNRITLVRTDADGFPEPGGNIRQIRSPNGRWIELSYDTNNRIIQAMDNIGRVIRYTYDANGRLFKVTNPNGGIAEYSYDASHRMLTLKDARGIVFLTNAYDAKGRVIKQTQADGGAYQFAYTVDDSDNITQTLVIDPRGNIRRVTFNASGYVLTDTRALGRSEEQSTTYERDPSNNLALNVTDPFQRKTVYTYDTNGDLTTITRLAGTSEAATTHFTYETQFSRVTTRTDALGHRISFAYDQRGNLTLITDALGNPTTLVIDSQGQAVSITDPLGAVLRFTHDSGDLATATDGLSRATKWHTDNAGRLIGETDPFGNTTQYDHDAANQLTKVTDPLDGVTDFAYDANGNLLSITDARRNITRCTYDEMDRLIRRTDPTGRSQTYEYDALGNLIAFTDRTGNKRRFTYDVLNRRSKIVYADGSTTTFVHDKADRLVEVADSITGIIKLSYDALDRLISETTDQGETSYTYDFADRRTGMRVRGQIPIAYEYDDGDRMVQVTQGDSIIRLTYDQGGFRRQLTLSNGVVVDYAYDIGSQLTRLGYRLHGEELGELTYRYDNGGNRTSIGGSFARTLLPESISLATYDSANRPMEWNGRSLTFDLNGNLLHDGVNNYTWDVRNRLASVDGVPSTIFRYDPFDRRIAKTEDGITTEFLYDGVNVAHELSDGISNASLTTSIYMDEWFARSDLDGTRIPIADGVGSILALLDSTGTVQTEYVYEPFGRTAVNRSPSSNAFQFTGREHDGTGLYYNRARYYHPILHRFVSDDPLDLCETILNLQGNPGAGELRLLQFTIFANPQLLHPAAYALNNPINYTDPTGEFVPQAIACGVGAGVSVAIDMARKKDIDWQDAAIGCVMGAVGLRVGGEFSRFRIFRWLNHNRYIRIGKNRLGGRTGLRGVRIGSEAWRDKWWSHWRLWP